MSPALVTRWAKLENFLTSTWCSGGQDLSGASDIRQWIAALYFAMTTVTTVGYGDITAHSAVEQVCSSALAYQT